MAAIVQRQGMAQGVNIHHGDRDEKTRDALIKLKALIKDHDNIRMWADNFGSFLKAKMVESQFSSEILTKARYALFGPRQAGEPYGPLLGDEEFTVAGFYMLSHDIVGRFWIFANQYADFYLKESPQASKEKENLRTAMITALASSYDDFGRVCNPGKVQRLCIALLQGRLPEINIDGLAFMPDLTNQTTPQASQMPLAVPTEALVPTSTAVQTFFSIKKHQKIQDAQELKAVAEKFLLENPLVARDTFLKELSQYAYEQGLIKELGEF